VRNQTRNKREEKDISEIYGGERRRANKNRRGPIVRYLGKVAKRLSVEKGDLKGSRLRRTPRGAGLKKGRWKEVFEERKKMYQFERNKRSLSGPESHRAKTLR